MKNTIPLIISLFICFSSFSCRNSPDQKNSSAEFANPVPPESVGFSSERLARIDSFLTDCVRKGTMPNAVTFVARHGKVVHNKAYGWKNSQRKEPVELKSIFRIASQTKALTSVGLMMLYEKSKFLLDDPVSKFIPEFKNPQVLVKIDPLDSSFTCRPAKREITVRHLLSGPLYVCKNAANQTYPVAGAKTYFSGGAGVVGTIQDYANFCKMLLNGGSFNGKQLLGRKTIELMRTNQIGDYEVWDRQNKFGLGFELNTEKGAALLPGSVGSFGCGGMYSTDYLIDPAEDLIMIIYTNVNPFYNPDINKRFKILVYQAIIDNKQ